MSIYLFYKYLIILGATEALNDHSSPVCSIYSYNYAKKAAQLAKGLN